MNNIEDKIINLLKELEKHIENNNKQQIEKDRHKLDKLLNKFLEKFK